MWSLRPAGGYYDQPPLIAWVLAAVRAVAGQSPLALRLAPIAMGVLGAVVLLESARDRGLLLLWWVAIPPLAWLTLFSTPDAFLLGAWAVGLAAGIRGGWGWLLAGLAAGLASQAKYTGFALYPLLMIGAGSTGIRDRRVWAGLALAAAIAMPNLAWNASNDWVTFRFQLGEGLLSPRAPGLFGPPIQIASQLAVVTPVAAVAGLAWLGMSAREVLAGSAEVADRMCWWTAAPLLVFFAVAAVGGPPEAHWPAPAWIGIGLGLARFRRLSRAAWTGAWFGLLCSIGLTIHGVKPWLSLPKDPGARLTEGPIIASVVGRFSLPNGVAAWDPGVDAAIPVYTERYQEAAFIHYYTGIDARVLPGCGRPSQYDLWPRDLPDAALMVRPATRGDALCSDGIWPERSAPHQIDGVDVFGRRVGRWQIFEVAE